MSEIDSVYKARTIRAAILKRVNHALDISEAWYGRYLLCRNSKWPNARRYALKCRAMAAIQHDRGLG